MSTDRETMRECQRGIVSEHWRSGSFCKKPDLCRRDGHCHFVWQTQRNAERAWRAPIPGRVVWSRRADDEDYAA